MTSVPRTPRFPPRSRCLALLAAIALVATTQAQTAPANASQQLVFAGLRSVAARGQINGVATDAAGDVYLAYDQGDGVRVLKIANDGSEVLASAQLGASGDSAVAIALDPDGNVYVAGTSTSGALAATGGAAFASATAATTNSFVAKFSANLVESFLTFTGGTRIAASALAATADRVFVSGIAYGSDLPVTANGVEQSPAYQSNQNGFVEAFSSDGTTLVYSTYITGAQGDTTPTAIAADAADNVWLVGSTSATGFPTTAAMVPNILSNPSGFLLRLTPGGDAIVFATFVPGTGLDSIALDTTGMELLIAGNVALGQFPVDTVYAPLLPTPYQVLLRVPLDGSSVTSGTVIAPGTQSVVTPSSGGGAWIAGQFSPAFLLPQPALAGIGGSYAVRYNPANGIDQTLRLGGLPNQQQTYASIPLSISGLAIDAAGDLFAAGAAQPTASSSLLATETYDFPLRGGPTTAFPSAVSDALPAPGTCDGSLCSGSAGYLAKVGTATTAPALTFSIADLPFVTLRNLGSVAATGLQLSASAGTITTTCGDTLAPGGECDALLTGGGAGTLTASASDGGSTSATFPAYAASAPASTVVFAPKELDFGIQSSVGTAAVRTITVANLGTAAQNFTSGIPSTPESTTDFSQASSDCTLASATTMTLSPGANCHIQVQLTASSDSANDGFVTGEWSIGDRQVLLTGYSQAAALSVSATEVDFGTQFQGGIALPRFLYLSNSASTAVSHTALSLPSSSPFTLTDGCPSQLPAASVCRIRLDYSSPVVPSNDSVNLFLDDGISVLLTGSTMPLPTAGGSTGGAEIAVSTSSITFATAVDVTAVSASTQTVSIANQGAMATPVSIALNGDFIDQSSCGTSLAAGATCAVAIQFTPSQPGVRQGVLTVSASPGVPLATVALSGTGTAILASNNGTLAFSGDPVGQPVVQFYKVAEPFDQLTLAATGPFRVTLIEDTGTGHGNPPSSSFAATVTSTCYNCWIGVRFQPLAVGAQNGTLSIASAPNGLPYALTLTGSGIATSGLILSPSLEDFGSIPVNSGSGSVQFTLTNLSANQAPLTVESFTTTAGFSAATASNSGKTCSGSLAYSASCVLSVAFQPTSTGGQTGTLTVTTSGGTATAQLLGTGTADPGIGVVPLALTFDEVAGSASTMQTVTLTNTGAVAVTVGSPTTLTSSFSTTTNCATLSPGAACAIQVSFQPGAIAVSDTLAIPVTTPGSGGTSQTATYNVALTGSYSTANIGLQVTPDSVSFGPNATSTQGTTRAFTLQNLTTKQLSLRLAVPQNYAIGGTPCTALAPGASCVETLQFVPLVNGDLPGTITVQAVPSDGSATITSLIYLDGFGVGTGTLGIGGAQIVNGTFNFGVVGSGRSASQTFVLANDGAAGSPPITVRGITSAAPFLSTSTCGAAMAIGQTCNITLTYTPTGGGASGSSSNTTDIGALTIESDAQSSPNTLNLTGQSPASSGSTAALATLTVSQGSLTFPATVVGDTSAAQTVTLTNTGNVTIVVSAVTATPDFSVQNGCATIPAGSSCTLSVASSPQSYGDHIAALEIATNGASSLSFISLIAPGEAPPLSFSPSSLTFGDVPVGTASILPITVANTSATPVQITGITGSSDFAVGGTCPAGGGTLAAQATCTAQVTFTPSATGQRTGTISFATSAATSPLTVTAAGTGTAPQLTANPATLAFGGIDVGSSATLSVTLTNAGSAPASGLALSVAGDYTVSSPCSQTTLAPGASCVIQVTFTPTIAGSRPGIVSIASSDPNSPLAIPLSGSGISTATFTLSVNGGTTATVTVVSGTTATYALLLTPVGSFGGNVALTCADSQTVPYASCSLQPSLVNLAGGSQASSATVGTLTSASNVGRLAPLAIGHPDRTFLTLLVPGALLMLRRRRNIQLWFGQALMITTFLGLLSLSGCGGGGSSSNINYTPPGNYQYVVTASSTSGIQVTQTVTLNLVVTAR